MEVIKSGFVLVTKLPCSIILIKAYSAVQLQTFKLFADAGLVVLTKNDKSVEFSIPSSLIIVTPGLKFIIKFSKHLFYEKNIEIFDTSKKFPCTNQPHN